MFQFFRRRKSSAASGVDADHVRMRKAIERCDSFKFAVDAGQMSISEVAERLLQNNFSQSIVDRALEECFGSDAAR
jgi:hypothetical protein